MQTGLILASLAASAAASANLMAMPQVKRDIAARQGDALPLPTEGACATAALGLVANFPTPAPAIVSDIVANPQTDPCEFTTPASLSKEYASYSSELLSWVSANEDTLTSALKECPQLSSYANAIPVCTSGLIGGSVSSALANATTPGVPSSTKTDGPSNTGSEDPATTPGGDSGAARLGGAGALVLAAAGLVLAL